MVEEVPHPLVEHPVVHVEPHDFLPFLCFPCTRLVVLTCESQAVEDLCYVHWEELYGHWLGALCDHLMVL